MTDNKKPKKQNQNNKYKGRRTLHVRRSTFTLNNQNQVYRKYVLRHNTVGGCMTMEKNICAHAYTGKYCKIMIVKKILLTHFGLQYQEIKK